uniref:Uncharacterized protein n=1 Tax=Setaria digitata TaxID=48799 RepID=A0A915Q7P4_9BILA
MDVDIVTSGEDSGVLTTISTPTTETKRARHKWTSAFRVMQSLHRLKNPPVGARAEPSSRVKVLSSLNFLRRDFRNVHVAEKNLSLLPTLNDHPCLPSRPRAFTLTNIAT